MVLWYMHLMTRLGDSELGFAVRLDLLRCFDLPLANELIRTHLVALGLWLKRGRRQRSSIPTDQMGRMIINYLGPPYKKCTRYRSDFG